MFRKIKVLLIAFVVFLSNVAFSATSAYSFIMESDFANKGSKIDIVKQCRGIVNMPKVFCDICVELTEEIIKNTDKNENTSNINTEYNYNDVVGSIDAIKNSNKKQKFIGFNSKDLNSFVVNNKNKFLYNIRDKFIFYIIQYIGLLRANDIINNTMSIKNIYFKTLFVI